MSLPNSNVRVEETLRIKINEAKNVPLGNQSSPKSRNVYCKLCLDQEEVFKTTVVKGTSNPYFGEETSFEIPRAFRFLNVYLCDKNESGVNGQISGALGKVTIPKQDLYKVSGKDHWFPVMPIDADSEVKGKVHLEVFPVNKSIAVRVKECRDLAFIKNTCDPLALVTITSEHPAALPKNGYSYKTKPWKRTTCPRFEETFYFPNDQFNYPASEIKVSIWHESSIWGNHFLGEVRIPLRNIQLKHSAWYYLKPRDQSRGNLVENCSIRLNIRYSSDHIISSECYDPLRQLLLESPSVTPITASSVFILGDICDDKIDVAKPVVRIFLHHGKLPELIRSLSVLEMDIVSDVNTLFRGNTLLSKCTDELMKVAGRFYLKNVLKDLIDKVYAENKCCEIDPVRLGDANDLPVNLEILNDYIDSFLDAITVSSLSCPVLISDLLAELKKSSTDKYPDRPEIQFSVVAGFILLRFFAAAILGPKLFDLRSEGCIPPNVARTLTLISKAVQSVGNCLSNENNKVILKELYMRPVMQKFCSEPYLGKMRTFLFTVSSANIIHSSPPVKLKDGFLTKRAQGRRKPFIPKNFKRRYFVLTTHELIYSEKPGSSALCRIPVSDIQAAEYVREDSFQMKNMLQVIQPHRQLYIQANHCVEAKEWLDALSFVVRRNQRKRDVYHPSAFSHSSWRCCQSTDRQDPGCCNVTKSREIHEEIDVDREVEKVYSLFVSNMEKLKSLQAHNQKDIFNGKPTKRHDDPVARDNMIANILKQVNHLDKEHRQHIKNVYQRHTYGSEYAPIGEDSDLNYLLLSTAPCADNLIHKSPLVAT